MFHDYRYKSKIKLSNLNVSVTNKSLAFMKWPIPPKVKEVQFKMINGYNPVAKTLRRRFKFEVDNCVFCNEEPETLEHLFFHVHLPLNSDSMLKTG